MPWPRSANYPCGPPGSWVAPSGGGGGAEDISRAGLERQTNEARIAHRVHFLGARDDVASLLWASDVYCQPNTQPEPFGISFIEALYAGLPVVATDLGGAREIVTPACGVLVPPRDPRALRDALERMMTDAGLRQRLRAAAPARAAALCAPEAAVQRLAGGLGGGGGRERAPGAPPAA